MSPVALVPQAAEAGYLLLPRRWSLAMLVGALAYGTAMIWQGALAYGRIGVLETSVAKNETRIEENGRDRERLARLEAQSALVLDALRRIDGKLDGRNR